MFSKKCKLLVSTFLTAAICISFSSVGTLAVSRQQDNRTTQAQSTTEQLENIAKQNLQKSGLKAVEAKEKKSGVIKPMARATPLTDAYLYAIMSQTSIAEHPDVKGYEQLDYSQWGKTTKFHHGGLTEVLVVEIGYANSAKRQFTYKGVKYDYHKMDFLTYSGTGKGEVYGFVLYYKIPNVDGGTIDYQSTSDVMPYNSFHDWVNIN
jgi:hypothetical protein